MLLWVRRSFAKGVGGKDVIKLYFRDAGGFVEWDYTSEENTSTWGISWTEEEIGKKWTDRRKSGYSLTPHNAKSARTRGRVVRGGKQGVLTLLSCELNLRRNVGAHGKERGGIINCFGAGTTRHYVHANKESIKPTVLLPHLSSCCCLDFF